MQDNLSVLNSPADTRSWTGLRRQPWLLLLAALLVIQLALVAVVYWPRGANVAGNEPLLPAVADGNVTELAITDNNGQSIQLRKEGESWVLVDTEGFPAREDKITTLLEKIGGLRTNRLVASSPASQPQLEVAADKFARRLDLTLADGSVHTLYIGTAPRARATHVRAEGRNEIFLASDLSSFDANTRVADWIDTAYFQVPREQVVQMTLVNGNGEFVFNKDEEGAWQMAGVAEGETFNPNNLTSLLTTLSGLSMVAPLGKTAQPEYGLDEPSAEITLIARDEDGEETTHTLTIGALNEEDNRYYVSSSDSPYIVQVANYSVENFVKRGRADFITVAEPADEEGTGAETEPAATGESDASETEPAAEEAGAVSEPEPVATEEGDAATEPEPGTEEDAGAASE